MTLIDAFMVLLFYRKEVSNRRKAAPSWAVGNLNYPQPFKHSDMIRTRSIVHCITVFIIATSLQSCQCEF